MHTREQISILAEKWLNGTITEQEKLLFETWYNRRKPDEIHWLGDETEATLSRRIFESVQAQIAGLDEIIIQAPVHKRLPKFRWMGIAVSIVLAGSVFFLYQSKPREETVKKVPAAVDLSVPAPPSSAKAIITLADGSQKSLDHFAAGDSIIQGAGVVLKKTGAQLVYSQTTPGAPGMYNKITVPRGSQLVSVVLADGTKVWLNVESSLHYPVSFNNAERKVTLTGEAYFEVSKKREKFIVATAGSNTEVLGTHFNINSYKPGAEQITLLEGLVKVQNRSAAVRELRPGQQVLVATRDIQLQTQPDLEAVMAWKNGLFKLNNADVYSIMQQLAQWYDVDVRFKGNLQHKRFSGMISRYTQLPVVLDMLSMTKEVRFVTEGKTITVSPY